MSSATWLTDANDFGADRATGGWQNDVLARQVGGGDLEYVSTTQGVFESALPGWRVSAMTRGEACIR